MKLFISQNIASHTNEYHNMWTVSKKKRKEKIRSKKKKKKNWNGGVIWREMEGVRGLGCECMNHTLLAD